MSKYLILALLVPIILMLVENIQVKDYVCSRVGCKEEMTVAIIKPDGIQYEKEIVAIIKHNGFTVVKDRKEKLADEKIDEWYFDKKDKVYFQDLKNYLKRDDIRILELSRFNAVRKLRNLIGPTDSNVARQEYPYSIRAFYGKDKQENAIHASDSKESAEREYQLFFTNDKEGDDEP